MIKENKGAIMQILSIDAVNSILDEYKENVCKDAFLSGSYRFNRANEKSDIDIVMPIMFKSDLIKYLDCNVISYVDSSYNAGVKFIILSSNREITINVVFLHPLDFVCWYKAADMILASKVEIKDMSRNKFHALHQIMVSLPKMMIDEYVDSNNYQKFINGIDSHKIDDIFGDYK